MCFPVKFAKSLRTPFFTENLRWLLLLKYFPSSYKKMFATTNFCAYVVKAVFLIMDAVTQRIQLPLCHGKKVEVMKKK